MATKGFQTENAKQMVYLLARVHTSRRIVVAMMLYLECVWTGTLSNVKDTQ